VKCFSNSEARVLARAIRKYGPDAFEISVVAQTNSYDEANELEVAWIAKLNSRVPNGYNVSPGGIGVRDFSDEQREAHSNMMRGVWARLSPEEKAERKQQAVDNLLRANARRAEEHKARGPQPKRPQYDPSKSHRKYKKSAEGWSPERLVVRSVSAKRAWENKSEEEKRETIQRRRGTRSPEFWREVAKKGVEAREARRKLRETNRVTGGEA